jgi:hypothetical protein
MGRGEGVKGQSRSSEGEPKVTTMCQVGGHVECRKSIPIPNGIPSYYDTPSDGVVPESP